MNDSLQRASVTLLINDDDLDPEKLTALFGREPNIGVRKGQDFVGYDGRVVTARTGMWHFGTGYREPPNIDQQIAELLEGLPGHSALWGELTTSFASCHIAVGIYFDGDSWTGGFMLGPQTLAMLGKRGLAIDFDMYAPGASK